MNQRAIPPQLISRSFVKLKDQSKSPFERDWPNKPYSLDEIELWFKGGSNYGVLTGCDDLCIVDADHPDSAKHFLDHFPKAFVVKTPGKGFHFYFACPGLTKSKIVLDQDGTHYGEVLGKGFQAVGPGSIHPEKKKPYEVFVAEPIAEITADLLAEIIAPFMTIKLPTEDCYESNISTILKVADIQMNGSDAQLQGAHPVHGSTSGKNFCVSLDKNCWYCFRHAVGGGPLHLIALLEDLIDCETLKEKGLSEPIFYQAKDLAISKYGLELNESRRGELFLSARQVDELTEKIFAIPTNTSHTMLPTVLSPIFYELANVSPAQVTGILREVIKKRFSLTNDFIKQFEKIINKRREDLENEAYKDRPLTKDEIDAALDEAEEDALLHPAQDFKDGKMFFGVTIKDQLLLACSNKKLADPSDPKQPYKLKHYAVDMTRFSKAGIKKWKGSTGSMIDPAKLFTSLREYISKYVVMPEDVYLNFLTLWVMGTYVFQIFRYFPYIWLNAEKGSGKTHLMEVLLPIVFNGDMAASVTESVLFRDVENNRCTMLIDEVEQMKKADKDKYGALMSILKAGFHREGAAKRTERSPTGEFFNKKYSAYSPKMIAGIEEIDEVLKDRTIKISLLRKKEGEQVQRYKSTPELEAQQKDLRDNLYTFALECAGSITEAYQGSDELVAEISHLKNRELDIWEPILVLAQLVDDRSALSSQGGDLLSQMIELSEKVCEDKRTDNQVENETVQLLECIKGLTESVAPDYEEGDELFYKTTVVLDYFNQNYDFMGFGKTNSLTMKLKKIKVSSKQKRLGGNEKPQCYVIEMGKLMDMCQRHDVQPPESARHSDILM